MRILEKYIVLRLIKSFVFLTLNFFLLYFIISLITDLQSILKDNASLKALFSGYLFNLLTISGRMITFAFLIASLHLIGTLNYQNEISAMRIQGVSIMSLAKIFIVSGILISLFCLFIENNLTPLMRKSQSLSHQKKAKVKSSEKIINNFAYYAQEGYFIFAKKFDVKRGELLDVNIFKEDKNGQLTEEIISSRLYWRNHAWHLEKGIRYELAANDFISQSKSETEEIIPLKQSPLNLARQKGKSWQYLSLKELRRSIKAFSHWKSSKIADLLKTELQKKIAFSFSPFFLLLAALPFALQIRTRHSGLSSLGTAIIFYFIYYVLSSLSLALGKADFFSPSVSAWLTNIFFGVSGIVGLLSIQ